MARQKFPITDEHRAKFKAFLDKWTRRLNLDDWRIEFEPDAASKGHMAEVSIDYEHRLAMFRIGKLWRTEPTDREIERTAVHELLHVRLADLVHFATNDDEEAMAAAEHALIVLLEKLLIPDA